MSCTRLCCDENLRVPKLKYIFIDIWMLIYGLCNTIYIDELHNL